MGPRRARNGRGSKLELEELVHTESKDPWLSAHTASFRRKPPTACFAVAVCAGCELAKWPHATTPTHGAKIRMLLTGAMTTMKRVRSSCAGATPSANRAAGGRRWTCAKASEGPAHPLGATRETKQGGAAHVPRGGARALARRHGRRPQLPRGEVPSP